MFDAPIHLKNQKLSASFEKHELQFKIPAKTSRESFTTKDTYLIKVKYLNKDIVGIGEASPLWTLSIDSRNDYLPMLDYVCKNINNWKSLLSNELSLFPSIQFGLETALLDLSNGGTQVLYPSQFTSGKDRIQINGLVWMNDFHHMSAQIKNKIDDGYRCVKLKIGAINWDDELTLLKNIRKQFSAQEIEIRVDANGAFSPKEALNKLDELAKLNIHSIEQPIKAGQIQLMKSLCSNTAIPIALDEELIGMTNLADKNKLLEEIKPQYIILKPSLIGGIYGTNEWIEAATKRSIDWWATSALEGNYGLNAIAQFVFQTKNKLPQGLGTGQLYTNNFKSRLKLQSDRLFFS